MVIHKKLVPPTIISPRRDNCPETKWKKCFSSQKEAKKCISELRNKYPDIFKFTSPVPGPVKAVIEEKGKVVGVVDNQGQIKPISPPVPPPPPNLIPKVKSTPGSRKDLLEQIRKGKELKKASPKEMREDRNELLQQIKEGKKLKKVTKCDVGYVYDVKLGRCIPVKKDVRAGDIGAIIAKEMERRRQFIK